MKRVLPLVLLGAASCGTITAGVPSEDDTRAPQGAAAISLAGVHWYSGDQAMLDTSVPAGRRGWNVETVIGADDEGAIGGSLDAARTARDHGLTNIIRIDYRPQLVVPLSPSDFGGWGDEFLRVVERFRGEGLATRFIVGNEANIESCDKPAGCTTAAQYAAAYNYLRERRPAGIELLVAGPATFSPDVKIDGGRGVFDYGGTFLDWLGKLASALDSPDGFALHSYGDPDECGDPGSACQDASGRFSRNFVGFREQLGRIARFGPRPVYLTEINTFSGSRHPQANYRAGWINAAFALLRDYNAHRAADQPPILGAAWFVDRDAGGWGDFALRNVPQAREDLAAELHDARNQGGGGGGCATAGLPTPGDRWKLEIFANPELSGPPVEVRQDAEGVGGFRFDWGDGGASGCAGVDRFSVRFSRRAEFDGGRYTFRASTDDGVRLWVDGTLVIDHWRDQAEAEQSGRIDLSPGGHDLRMDYYENGGGSVAALAWTREGRGAPPPSCACRSGVNNFCHYPPSSAGCQMTAPGGYCDPNGDGGYDDADWVRGYNEFHDRCP